MNPWKDHLKTTLVIELLNYRLWTNMFLDFDQTLFLLLFVFSKFLFLSCQRAKVTQWPSTWLLVQSSGNSWNAQTAALMILHMLQIASPQKNMHFDAFCLNASRLHVTYESQRYYRCEPPWGKEATEEAEALMMPSRWDARHDNVEVIGGFHVFWSI